MRVSTRIRAIFLILVMGSCKFIENPKPPSVSVPSLASLQSRDTLLPADSDTTTTLTATVASGDKDSLGIATIEFTTDLGLFLESGTNSVAVQSDSTGVAIVRILAPRNNGLATVRASDSRASRSVNIRFDPAYPDTLLIAPSTFVILDTAVITVTASLRRLSGFVTPGDTVHFAA